MKTMLTTLALLFVSSLAFSQSIGSGIYLKYLAEVETESLYDYSAALSAPTIAKEPETTLPPIEIKEWSSFHDDGGEIKSSHQSNTTGRIETWHFCNGEWKKW